MDTQKYKDDLHEIREMMSRSSRFISLSGMSGVSAGVIALIAAYIVYRHIYVQDEYLGYNQLVLSAQNLLNLLGIAATTLVLSIGAGIYFTTQKARKNNQKLWDQQTHRLLINLAIPLATGGLLILILLGKGFIGMVAPLTLIFYGLALVNASKYTLHEVRSLGMIEIALGLLASYFIGFGLLFWAIGFGLFHIAYGIYMELKYSN